METKDLTQPFFGIHKLVESPDPRSKQPQYIARTFTLKTFHERTKRRRDALPIKT